MKLLNQMDGFGQTVKAKVRRLVFDVCLTVLLLALELLRCTVSRRIRNSILQAGVIAACAS
jgi:hypothetical protein